MRSFKMNRQNVEIPVYFPLDKFNKGFLFDTCTMYISADIITCYAKNDFSIEMVHTTFTKGCHCQVARLTLICSRSVLRLRITCIVSIEQGYMCEIAYNITGTYLGWVMTIGYSVQGTLED